MPVVVFSNNKFLLKDVKYIDVISCPSVSTKSLNW